MIDEATRFARAEEARAAEDWSQAEAEYTTLLAGNRAHVAAWRGLAAVLDAMGKTDAARDAARKGDRAEAENLVTMAGAAAHHGRRMAALSCLERAARLAPDDRDIVWSWAEAAQAASAPDQARAAYARYLEIDPTNEEAAHMLAALGGGAAPARASDGYVIDYFARFADGYDDQLLNDLDYRGPALLLAAVRQVVKLPEPGSPDSGWDILDLGCGTGLSGAAFRPHARHLSGVDLSEEMLEKARGRSCYDRLAKAEGTEFLAAHTDKFDLIVAADMFPYLGDLGPILRAAAGALRPGGLIAFTVERGKKRGFQITRSGRYQHKPAYIDKCAAAAGLTRTHAATETLRTEYGEPVTGYITVLQKPGAG